MENWEIRKIDPIKKDYIANVYHFYKKFNLEEVGFIKAELATQNCDLIFKNKKTHSNARLRVGYVHDQGRNNFSFKSF